MNRDLFLAILSMDSYNRGYGPQILQLPNAIANAADPLSGTRIGRARLVAQSDTGFDQGFYADVFDATGVTGFSAGERVVVFRGTDSYFDNVVSGGSDPTNGWRLGLGNVSEAPQAQLAAAFYCAQTTAANALNPYNANVSVTGHSLGGGLAGFVAGLFGAEATIFDGMAYEYGVADAFYRRDVAYYGGADIQRPDLSHIVSEEVIGQALDGLFGADTNVEYDSYADATIGSRLKHSAALQVDLIFARDPQVVRQDWHYSGTVLWKAYFDDTVANAIVNATTRTNDAAAQASAGDTLRAAIAYSALDSGERPFGDTGVRAMFDDAADLGTMLDPAGDSPSALAPYTLALAKTFVQFAGELALNRVYAASAPDSSGPQTVIASAVRGILSLSSANAVLNVDFRAETWAPASGGVAPAIAGEEDLLGQILKSQTVPDIAMPWGKDFVQAFDRVSIGTDSLLNTATLAESRDQTKASLYVGTSGADLVIGSSGRDLLLGNGGADTLNGGGGDDILVSDGGGDILSGAVGLDTYILAGASGDITIDDDTGKLDVDGIVIGTASGSAPEGSLESGVAISDQDIDRWTLGKFTLTMDGADLLMTTSNQTIRLKGFYQGDYGILLGQDGFLFSPYYTMNFDEGAALHNIVGTPRNDYVSARGVYSGSFSITTGDGYDFIDSNADPLHIQTVDSGAGSDRVSTHGGPGTVSGGDGDDRFQLNASSVALTSIYGGNGRDVFTGYGARSIDGGPGIDTWHFLSQDRAQTENGDTIVDVSIGAFSIAGTPYAGTFRGIEVFDVLTGNGDDVVVTGDKDNTVFVGEGNNKVITGSGNDRIGLGSGINVVNSGAGNDSIGAFGQDTIDAGPGDDDIDDVNYAPSYVAKDGTSVIHGGDGNDYIRTYRGQIQTVYGDDGNDYIASSGMLSGGTGDDVIYAGRSSTIQGGPGYDRIYFRAEPEDLLVFNTGDGFDDISLTDTLKTDPLNETINIEINGARLAGTAKAISSDRWQIDIGFGPISLYRTVSISPDGTQHNDLQVVYTSGVSDQFRIQGFFDHNHALDGEINGLKLAVNHPPVRKSDVRLPDISGPDYYTLFTSSLLAGFTDEDGDVLRVDNDASVDHGSLSRLASGDYLYLVQHGYEGPVTISYHVNDQHGGVVAANATFVSHTGSEVLTGTDSDDLIYGLDGDDIIDVSQGRDFIDGGDGVDYVRYVAQEGSVPVSTDYRSYTIRNNYFSDSSGVIKVAFANIESIAIDTRNATCYNAFFDASQSSVSVKYTVVGFRNTLLGSKYDDLINVGAGQDVVDGGAGTDTLTISLYGGLYENITSSVLNGALVFASSSTARQSIQNIEKIIFSQQEEPSLVASIDGSSSAVSLVFNSAYGGFRDDTLIGGSASDTFFLSSGQFYSFGKDKMTGGPSGDLYRGLLAGFDGDSITDLTSEDRIEITDATYNDFNFTRVGTSLAIGGGHGLVLSNNPVGRFVTRAATDGSTTLRLADRMTGLSDFDGNGHSDILWREAGGTFSTWDTSGNTAGNQFAVNSTFVGGVGTDWKIQETFDWDGDGRSDILWRNQNSGEFTIWTGKGDGWTVNAYDRPGIGTNWKIAGVGDLNGDGKDDIVWREGNGAFSTWQSTGTGFNVNVDFDTSVSPDWQIVGLGDFDSDGKNDLLWRNQQSGAFSTWTSNGTGFTPNTNFVTSVDTSWHIDGLADFNGDGRDDILWRHDGDGAFSVWQANASGGFTPNTYFNTSVAPVWQVQTTGDYNDDGRADILWRNTATGDFSTWQSNGNGFDPNAAFVSGVGTNWQVQGHNFQFG